MMPETKVVLVPLGVIFQMLPLLLWRLFPTNRSPLVSNAMPSGPPRPETKGVTVPLGATLLIVPSLKLVTKRVPEVS